MQLHIWQQFSSNHSSDCTVIGEFATPDAAQKAVQEVRSIFRTIMQWHMENPDAYDLENKPEMTPSPPERQMAEKYGVEWYGLIDWIFFATPPPYDSPDAKIDRAVVSREDYSESTLDKASAAQAKLLDRFVFVQPSIEAWAGPPPFDEILKKLGGETSFDLENYHHETHFALKCQAKSPNDANRLKSELVRQYESDHEVALFEDEVKFVPWGIYTTRPINAPTININENSLQIEDLYFFTYSHDGLSALVDWLRTEGCMEINITMQQVIRPS